LSSDAKWPKSLGVAGNEPGRKGDELQSINWGDFNWLVNALPSFCRRFTNNGDDIAMLLLPIDVAVGVTAPPPPAPTADDDDDEDVGM